MKKTIIVLMVIVLSAVQAFACAAITKKGTQCKRAPSPGSQYCWQHGGTTAAQRAAGLTDADVAKMRCKAITKAGEPVTKTQSEPVGTRTAATETAPAVAAERVQGDAITKDGKRCRRKALQGGTKCWQHAK